MRFTGTSTKDLLTRTSTLVTAGRITRLDLLRAQQIDEELNSEQAAIGHAIERARRRLATLTGRTGEGWTVADSEIPSVAAATLPVGGAAGVLQRRPDIAAGSLRVDAAAARAGLARAELFPRVEFSGSLGLVAGSRDRFRPAREGLVDSLSRTLAERDSITGALVASRALTSQQQAVVQVYRALGGGWR